MTPWIISDTHFNHKKIVEYCHRPPDHEERLLEGISHLGIDDCLIHLGDFSFGQEAYWFKRMKEVSNCTKILVLGNHDQKSWSYYMNDWHFVCDSFKIKYGGKNICFSHKPVPWDGDWDLNIFGHLHNLPQISHHKKEFKQLQQWHRCYAPELNDYKPVKLDEFIQKGEVIPMDYEPGGFGIHGED